MQLNNDMTTHTNKLSVIDRIDRGLGIYYNCFPHIKYKTNDGIGKFSAFCQDQFDNDQEAIIDEINCTAEDCMLIAFDDAFPIHHHIQNERKRVQLIYEIIKHCYLYGAPPIHLLESKQPTQIINSNKFIKNGLKERW
eukprot:349496_1